MTGTPLYLLALIVAIASTPLDIFQVNAWGYGTVALTPWSRRLSATVTRARTWFRRMRSWLTGADGLRAVAISVLILAMFIAPDAQAGLLIGTTAVVAPTGLKALRQRDSEL